MRAHAMVLALLTLLGASCRPSRPAAALIVTGGHVVTMNAAGTVLSPGAIAIGGDRGDTIVGIGTPSEILAQFAAREVLDASNQIVLPGLINTHTHAPMVMYRGLADDRALMEWLNQYIFPAEAKTVSPEMVRVGTRLAALEMIESGTTAYADMYYFEEEIAKATRAAGLRGVLGQTIIQFPVADAKSATEGLARADAFIRAFKDDPLIVPAVAPHAMYTLPADALQAAAALGRKYDVPVLIHLAETEDELKQSLAAHQMTPTAYLESLGFWSPRTLAAHGVWVNADDLAILARRHVPVSHNPESNMKLASGTAPVPQYLAAGVTVSLGTDGAASNNDLDMFEAMRQAAMLAKHGTRDPTAVPAPAALAMATIGGARALGLDRLTGSLEIGKRADLITVGVDSARFTPLYDPVSHLVYVARGTDVRSSVVNGRILMLNRRTLTLDRREVLADANRLAIAVKAAVNR